MHEPLIPLVYTVTSIAQMLDCVLEVYYPASVFKEADMVSYLIRCYVWKPSTACLHLENAFSYLCTRGNLCSRKRRWKACGHVPKSRSSASSAPFLESVSVFVYIRVEPVAHSNKSRMCWGRRVLEQQHSTYSLQQHIVQHIPISCALVQKD